MLATDSSNPPKAIRFTLIARGLRVDPLSDLARDRADRRRDLWGRALVESKVAHIRKYGPLTPSDFDVSPFFIVKPTIASG
jgi:hypothetical protein